MAGSGARHLGLVLLAEGGPLGRGLGGLTQLHGLGAGGQVGEPDVVPILAGKIALGHAARRAAHCADAQSLIGETGAAEADDGEGHVETLLLFGHFQRLTVADHLLQAARHIAELGALVEADAVAAHVGHAAAGQGAGFAGIGHRLIGIGLA